MRILVLSDIHGNLAAVQTIAALEPHDAVICLGDVVGYGPEPSACVHWAQASVRLIVQGNHDRAFGEGVPPRCSDRFRWLAEATSPIAHAQLGPGELAYLGALPRWAYLRSLGTRYMFIHATPSDPLYRYLGPNPDAWDQEVQGLDADVVFVGHTHVQFDIAAGGRRVVNPGSVGQPKDGDPRAAYAVIENGVISLRRAAYQVHRTVDALRRANIARAAVSEIAQLLETGRVPPAPAAHPASPERGQPMHGASEH